jgi:hypothetical protein
MDLNVLRKKARLWVGSHANQLSRHALVSALRQALENDSVAVRVLESLSPVERTVAAIYRRYGGSVSGEVIRLDLMARGLLEIVEEKYSAERTVRRWKSNPVQGLVDSGILISEQPEAAYSYSSYYHHGPEHSFERYSLHAGVARLVKPAGPPPWSMAPTEGTPTVATIRRMGAEVALDLIRAFAFVNGRRSIKVRNDGCLSTPVLRAMEGTSNLDQTSELRLVNPQGLFYELLRAMGAVRTAELVAVPDPSAAGKLIGQPTPWQAHLWARGWLVTRGWFDGHGVPSTSDRENYWSSVYTGRQVLAWALSCLARVEDCWYELSAFLEKLYANLRHVHPHFPILDPPWKPKFPSVADPLQPDFEHRRLWWFNNAGVWYANALMVTLVALGLVERGRRGDDPAASHCFRLTELGRAVFGAPDVNPLAEPAAQRYLVIQPNFDIVAYLEQADAPTAGFLGRIAESGSARSGPVQTFRLTQTSIYEAEEGGLSHAQIVAFLEQHSQRELPANVARSLSDWSGKRESLSLRAGVTVLGFPTKAERDGYLERHAGMACGERLVLGPAPANGLVRVPGSLVSDHLLNGRHTIELDEQGQISVTQSLDIVQTSRLRRIAQAPTSASSRWQLTGDSMRRAAGGGLKPGMVHRWLKDHLARPAPPLIAAAIDSWLKVGSRRPVELADTVLLHVPDQEQAKAIATSARLRPFLIGRVGPGWLVVNKKFRKQLADVLEELGFTLSSELTHEELRTVDERCGLS